VLLAAVPFVLFGAGSASADDVVPADEVPAVEVRPAVEVGPAVELGAPTSPLANDLADMIVDGSALVPPA
jgi:hypothetical protein